MTIRFVVFAIVAALVSPVSSRAQERVSLQDAISGTLANNPDLRAARAGQRESDARVREARSSYLPRVDFVESWQRGNNPVFVFGSLLSQQRFSAANFAVEALNHPDALTNYHSAFSVDQPLFDSSRLAGIRSARIGSELAKATVTDAEAGLALDATRAYGDVLLANANRAAALAAVATAREDLARAERSRDVGMVTEADVLSLRVHLAQMQEREIRAGSGEQVATAFLNRLMGAPLDRTLILAEPAAAAVAAPPIEDSERAALRDRASLARATAQVSLAETARAAAHQAFLPQVFVQGVYELNGHTFGDRASSWMIAGQARVNLFAGGGDVARLRAATEAASRARAERESAETGIRLDVRTARAQLDAAAAREAVGRAVVLQARESQRIIRDRYEAGLASVNDILRAANALLDAESLRISAIVDLMVARGAFDRAVGKLPSGSQQRP
ncbi:MAG TPA: TolC family protein [Vicinamibacterales bacterium]|jgi:outer membrane protein TolC